MSALQAFMFLQEAETMPVDAPDEWFLQRDPAYELIARVDDLVAGLTYILSNIADGQTEEELQAVFYEAGKLHYGTEKEHLRMFFRGLYQILFQRPTGPRWGQFVAMMGVDDFSSFVRDRLDNPLMFQY